MNRQITKAIQSLFSGLAVGAVLAMFSVSVAAAVKIVPADIQAAVQQEAKEGAQGEEQGGDKADEKKKKEGEEPDC